MMWYFKIIIDDSRTHDQSDEWILVLAAQFQIHIHFLWYFFLSLYERQYHFLFLQILNWNLFINNYDDEADYSHNEDPKWNTVFEWHVNIGQAEYVQGYSYNKQGYCQYVTQVVLLWLAEWFFLVFWRCWKVYYCSYYVCWLFWLWFYSRDCHKITNGLIDRTPRCSTDAAKNHCSQSCRGRWFECRAQIDSWNLTFSY